MQGPRWLNKLERKFGKFAIPNLMNIIIFGMVIVFVIDTFLAPQYETTLSDILMFDRAQVLQGQVWRLITFVFIPPAMSVLFAIFVLYFYWIMGTSLEANWGSFRFNVFYGIGVVCNIIAGCITGYATSYYLNLVLFLAYAMLYPNERILLFFFIPIKIKWIAWVDAAFLIASFVFASWGGRLAILFSVANFLVFFGRDLWMYTKLFFRRIALKFKKKRNDIEQNQNKNWKNHWWNDKDNDPFH